MVNPEHAQVLARYNSWMNGNVFGAASTLNNEARKKDSGAFFRSIHGTLNHLLWADSVWLARFQDLPRPPGSYGTELFSDFEELRQMRRSMDARIEAWAGSLTEEWLGGYLRWHSGGSNREIQMPAWLCVVHLFNHQTHHRGQLTTLLTQNGVDVGCTDLPSTPGLEDLL